MIPTLIKTLDEFLSVLTLSKNRPDQIFDVLEASSLAGNVFLKHLCILADFGGEPLMRVNENFNVLFPKISGTQSISYMWRDKEYAYEFQGLPVKGLNNKKLKIDGSSFATNCEMDAVSRDVAMILLHGAASLDHTLAAETLRKCDIGMLIGCPDDLEQFVKEKYIHVSRITAGAEANTLGQIAQQHVKEFIQNSLGSEFNIRSGTITLSSGENEVFDIIVEKGGRAVGIEVSFQVTTNSVIERKARQAMLRHESLHRDGHRTAYVLDGAGNFKRRSAITRICEYSDCTVAYSDDEFEVLTKFIVAELR